MSNAIEPNIKQEPGDIQPPQTEQEWEDYYLTLLAKKVPRGEWLKSQYYDEFLRQRNIGIGIRA